MKKKNNRLVYSSKERQILNRFKYNSVDDCGNIIPNSVILLAVLLRAGNDVIVTYDVQYNEISISDGCESSYAWIPSNYEVLIAYYAMHGKRRAFKMLKKISESVPEKVKLVLQNEEGKFLETESDGKYETLQLLKLIENL